MGNGGAAPALSRGLVELQALVPAQGRDGVVDQN